MTPSPIIAVFLTRESANNQRKLSLLSSIFLNQSFFQLGGNLYHYEEVGFHFR